MTAASFTPPSLSSSAEAMVAAGLPTEVANAAEAIRLFSDLLASENVALRERAIDRIVAMQERKTALARLYEDRLHVLADKPDVAKTLDTDWKQDLRVLAERLESLAQENALLLKAHMTAAEKVLEAIANAVKKVQPAESSYSRGGTLNAGSTHETLAFSLNQTI